MHTDENHEKTPEMHTEAHDEKTPILPSPIKAETRSGRDLEIWLIQTHNERKHANCVETETHTSKP